MDKRAISDMISYYHNEPWVAHTLKVFGYAQGIAAGENLSGEELEAEEPSLVISRRPCALLKSVKPQPALREEDAKSVGCKACLTVGCPAISFKDGKAVIDSVQCLGCGVCAYACRTGALVRSASEERR